jgi:hypothetical protein
MELNFSFLNNEEAFIELNPNILETNLVNILILIGLLLYANKTSFSVTLADRKKVLFKRSKTRKRCHCIRLLLSSRKGFTQSLFWLQSWKLSYEEKSLVNTTVKKGLSETFDTTENLITNFENKSFLALQRYMIL